MGDVWPRITGASFTSQNDVSARRAMEVSLIKAAENRGQSSHPAVAIARENLITLDRIEKENARTS